MLMSVLLRWFRKPTKSIWSLFYCIYLTIFEIIIIHRKTVSNGVTNQLTFDNSHSMMNLLKKFSHKRSTMSFFLQFPDIFKKISSDEIFDGEPESLFPYIGSVNQTRICPTGITGWKDSFWNFSGLQQCGHDFLENRHIPEPPRIFLRRDIWG